MSNRTSTPTDVSNYEGNNKSQYEQNTLLTVIIDSETAMDTPNRDEVVSAFKEILNKNYIFRLREWADLLVEDKNKYPDGLKMLLNKACKSEEFNTYRLSEKSADLEKFMNEILFVIEQVKEKAQQSYFQVATESHLTSPTSLELPYVGRCDVAKVLLKHIQERILKGSDKMDNKVPYIACCGGLGKTRFLIEQKNALQRQCSLGGFSKEVKEFVNQSVQVNLTFHNGQGVTNKEKTSTIENSKYFAIRLLSAYFLRDVKHNLLLEELFEKFNHIPLFNVETAVRCILRCAKTPYIIIGIDEYSALLREGCREYLKRIVNDCGILLTSRANYFAHMLFAGTTSTEFAGTFTGSFYYSTHVPLSLLSFDETKQVIQELLEKKDTFKILLGKLNIDSVTAFIGGHPRSIEVLYRYLIEWTKKAKMVISTNLITTLHSKMITEINSLYQKGAIKDPTMVLCHWALRSRLRRDHFIDIGHPDMISLDTLEAEGWVILQPAKNNSEEFIIELPVAWIADYLNIIAHDNILFNPLVNIMQMLLSNEFHWQNLESFAQNYYLLRINSAILLKKKSISLQALLGECKSLNSISLILSDKQINLKPEALIPQDKYPHRYPEKYQPMPQYATVALNCVGAAADVIIRCMECEIYIQCKYTASQNRSFSKETILLEVKKMIKAVKDSNSTCMSKIPKIFLFLTNLKWLSDIEPIEIEENMYSFYISKSELINQYGYALGMRLMLA